MINPIQHKILKIPIESSFYISYLFWQIYQQPKQTYKTFSIDFKLFNFIKIFLGAKKIKIKNRVKWHVCKILNLTPKTRKSNFIQVVWLTRKVSAHNFLLHFFFQKKNQISHKTRTRYQNFIFRLIQYYDYQQVRFLSFF